MRLDVVVPKDNEKQLLCMAEVLGFKELIFLSLEKKVNANRIVSSRLKLHRAFYINNINDVAEAKKHFDLIFAPASREFFESTKVDYIVLSDNQDSSDFLFQRRADLDDVLCALAKEKNKKIVFDTSSVNGSVVLGRALQDAKLCRKHELDSFVASFATGPLEMRAPKDLEAFERTLRLK